MNVPFLIATAKSAAKRAEKSISTDERFQ